MNTQKVISAQHSPLKDEFALFVLLCLFIRFLLHYDNSSSVITLRSSAVLSVRCRLSEIVAHVFPAHKLHADVAVHIDNGVEASGHETLLFRASESVHDRVEKVGAAIAAVEALVNVSVNAEGRNERIERRREQEKAVHTRETSSSKRARCAAQPQHL
jgi:hypothetical protein